MIKEVVEINTQEEWDYVVEKIACINAKSPEHNFRNKTRYVNVNCFGYDSRKEYYTSLGYEIISLNEFKSRYELKIGDTFEYKGFVCEVKEEVKKWYKIEDNKNNKVAFEKLCKQDVLDIEKLPYAKLTEITNKEFIKQLEENAR